MKIKHIEQKIDGEENNYLELELIDIRYPNTSSIVQLSLDEAMTLSRELDVKLSAIPI